MVGYELNKEGPFIDNQPDNNWRQSGLNKVILGLAVGHTLQMRLRTNNEKKFLHLKRRFINNSKLVFMQCIDTSRVTTAQKIYNDLNQVIIMTQIMTQSNENTDPLY